MTIWVAIERTDDGPSKPARIAVGVARRIAGHVGASLNILVIPPSTLFAPLQTLNPLFETSPDVLFLPHDSFGRDMGPRIAARFGGTYLSECTGVTVDGASVSFMRPVYGGRLISTVTPASGFTVATIRPMSFSGDEAGGALDGFGEVIELPEPATRWGDVREVVMAPGKINLTEASVVVSGGRGMSGPGKFSILDDLAALLGGAVGASRAAVDAGWMPHSRQVGQTGKVVSPRLYIACGISGAPQHLAGMSTSRTILAINKDANAPIFRVADIGIVGDLFEVVPKLIAEIRKG